MSVLNQSVEFKPPAKELLSAVILAGGQGSRVGFQQKALLDYQGQPLLVSVLDRLIEQASSHWVSIHTDPKLYLPYCSNLIADESNAFLGPLAGMQAAWHQLDSEWLLFVPCDNPCLPLDLVNRLIEAYYFNPSPLVVAFDGERIQPLYLLMHRSMVASLDTVIAKSFLSVYRWIEESDYTTADFSDLPKQAFQNLNTLELFHTS